MHVGEAVIAACIPVGKLLVVYTHLMQYGGVEIVDVDAVLDGVPAVPLSFRLAEQSAREELALISWLTGKPKPYE